MTTLPLATHRLRATPTGWAVDRATASGGWARPTYHGRLAAVERAELTVTRAALAVGVNRNGGGDADQ